MSTSAQSGTRNESKSTTSMCPLCGNEYCVKISKRNTAHAGPIGLDPNETCMEKETYYVHGA